MTPVSEFPVWAPVRGLQERSEEGDCEGRVILTGWREGGVPGGEVGKQGSVGK